MSIIKGFISFIRNPGDLVPGNLAVRRDNCHVAVIAGLGRGENSGVQILECIAHAHFGQRLGDLFEREALRAGHPGVVDRSTRVLSRFPHTRPPTGGEQRELHWVC